MKKLFPPIVRDAHAYTRSDEPWDLTEYQAAKPVTLHGHRFGWRLFHYISSGGMSAFGRNLAQARQDRRQTRFIVYFVIIAIVWFLIWIT